MKAAQGHFGRRLHAGRRPRRGAFTLVELLTVVVIIALLAAILLPTVVSAIRAACLVKTRTRVGSLSTACELYKRDHSLYPGQAVLTDAARGLTGSGGPYTGSQVLAACVYGFDVASANPMPRGGYDVYKDEFLREILAGPRPRVMADGFPQGKSLAICYYPAVPGEETLNQYRYEHNQAHTDFKPANDRPDAAQQKAQFLEFIQDRRAGGDRPCRPTEFLIVAAGASRKFFVEGNVTNFGP